MLRSPPFRPLVLGLGLALVALPGHAQFTNMLGNLLGAAKSLASTTSTSATTEPATSATTAEAGATQTAAAAPAGPAAPPSASAAQVEAALTVAPTLLDASGNVKGNIDNLKGRRFYVAEYRVMFEQSGSITANTRAAYLGGTNYSASRMTVRYAAPPHDVAALQIITDRAYADFLARLEAAGAKPEPADAVIREFGTVYDATADASKPGAPLVEEVTFGYGKRSYLVMAPTGMKMVPRGFAGLGAGNMGNRMTYIKSGVEALSVVLAVNIAAQESSGSGSSLFRRGSTANASAAMEVARVPAMVLLQGHAATNMVHLETPLAVPGQFANFRETGGYDTRKDATMVGLTVLGNLMGHAVNQSKSIEMAVDIDPLAMAPMSLQGLASVHQAIAARIK